MIRPFGIFRLLFFRQLTRKERQKGTDRSFNKKNTFKLFNEWQIWCHFFENLIKCKEFNVVIQPSLNKLRWKRKNTTRKFYYILNCWADLKWPSIGMVLSPIMTLRLLQDDSIQSYISTRKKRSYDGNIETLGK